MEPSKRIETFNKYGAWSKEVIEAVEEVAPRLIEIWDELDAKGFQQDQIEFIITNSTALHSCSKRVRKGIELRKKERKEANE